MYHPATTPLFCRPFEGTSSISSLEWSYVWRDHCHTRSPFSLPATFCFDTTVLLLPLLWVLCRVHDSCARCRKMRSLGSLCLSYVTVFCMLVRHCFILYTSSRSVIAAKQKKVKSANNCACRWGCLAACSLLGKVGSRSRLEVLIIQPTQCWGG